VIISGSSRDSGGPAAACRTGWLVLLLSLLLACPAQAALNLAYLVPGSGVKVHKQFRTASDPIKVCALTFDDGPDETYTMQVMQTLDHLKVRATFFVVGERVEEFPEQIKLLDQSGHEIGNHSYTHPDMAQLSTASQRSQMTRTTEILHGLGIEPKWFRPPYGSASRTTINLAEDLGMDVVRWSVDPRDWAQPGVSTISKRILRETCPGAVVLMHSTNAQTVAALPDVIAGLRGRGYTFVTLSQWKAVVTGKIKTLAELRPFVPEFTEITTIDGLADPFYSPYGAEPVPVVFEELEHLSPQDSAHDIWNNPAANENAPVVLQNPGGPRSLTVYSNFQSLSDLNEVHRTGGTSDLYAFRSVLPAEPVVTEVAPAALMPPVVQELTPELIAVPAEPVELAAMPELEFQLTAGEHPLPWAQPELLRTESLNRVSSVEGMTVTKLYLRVSRNVTDSAYWAALDAYTREARIDGLVFPTATFFGSPPSGLSSPWTFAGPQVLSGIPVVSMDGHPSHDLLALSSAGVPSVLLDAPSTAAALSERNSTDVIMLRQLTAGLPSVPRPQTASSWALPPGVLMCCFGDAQRTVIILANNSDGSLDLELLSPVSFLSFASWSGPDAIRLEPVTGNTLYTGAGSLLVLYHDQTVALR